MKYIFMAVLALLSYSCVEPVDEELVSKGGITGSVSDQTTGDPVSTVNVVLSPGGRSTVTGSDGSFEFTELDAGNYMLTIKKEGYNPNTKEVEVVDNRMTQAFLLIERIPAVVTADTSELDFGEEVSTLAFSIVNPGYETLEWYVEYDKKDAWISEIKPNEGALASGKTAAIVVNIDREKLKSGINEQMLVVVSTNGKHEIKVKAIGEARELPALNMLSETQVTSSTAVVNAEMTNDGIPKYTERGFIYGTKSNPNHENCIGVKIATNSEEKLFSCILDNLELNQTYYVKAFAKNSIGEVFSPNEIKVIPIARQPKVVVTGHDNVSVEGKTAKVHGEVTEEGDPKYTEKGFVYGFSSNPSLKDYSVKVEGLGAGTYYAQLSDLFRDKQYYVRGYIISDIGTFYSENEEVFTVATTPPSVSIRDVSNPNVADKTITLNGCVDNEGVPVFSERGFVYGLSSNPTISDNRVSCPGVGIGEYSIKISELEANKTYYVRAYATYEGGVIYSEAQKTFMLSTKAAEVIITEVTNKNVDAGSVVLNAEITDEGTPKYTERGFVYNTSGNPSLMDEVIVARGSGMGVYSAKASNLQLNTQYYVKAYVVNEHGTTYSSQQVFEISTTAPVTSVDGIADCNYTTASAIFRGSMSEVGNPKFTERGFVYGTTINPNIYNNKLVASSTGDVFSMSVSDLKADTRYWVRCYAIQNGEVFYSSNELDFKIAATLPTVNSLMVSNIDYETKSAQFTANVTSVGDPTMSEKGFVYGTTTNPNVYDNEKISSENNIKGEYTLTARGLMPGVTYYVKAYVKNDGGVAYSEEAEFSLTYVTPTLGSVYVDENNLNDGTATVRSSVTADGNPKYIERGFVYASHSSPTIADNYIVVSGSGVGSFSGKLENLGLDKNYYIKAYVKTEIDYYYSSYVRMSTSTTPPTVSSPSVTQIDVINRTATVQSEISSTGKPSYVERGFVYSETNNTPTINDTKIIVPGVDVETFGCTLTDLKLETCYYIRTYATTKAGTYYSKYTEKISTVQSFPTVKTAVTAENYGTKSAVFAGQITYAGNPRYTEVGFVYSTTNMLPDINDTKCVVSNVTNNIFSYNATNLPSSGPIYVRAYAINQKGVAYAENVVKIFDPAFVIYDGYVEIPALNLAVVYNDLGECGWDAAKELCSGLQYGGYTDWRLPTIGELSSISAYNKRLGFRDGSGSWYWSSDLYNADAAYVYSFYYNLQKSYPKTNNWYVLAVRTL